MSHYNSTFNFTNQIFRKYGGRLIVGNSVLDVQNNTGNTLKVVSNNGPVTLRLNQIYTLYDDDDYNGSDGLNWDGDIGEDIDEQSRTFKLMLPEDYITTNLLAAAYIQPEYLWAFSKGYNQSDTNFRVNVETEGVTSDAGFFTRMDNNVYPLNNPNNTDPRSEDFWVSYMKICYQPGPSSDFENYGESPLEGVNYEAETADIIGNNPTYIPSGSYGDLIFIETMRDSDDMEWPGFELKASEWTAIHEMGHQMGLGGDNTRFNYGIMNPPQNPFVPMVFVPQHINVLRWRRLSPGQH